MKLHSPAETKENTAVSKFYVTIIDFRKICWNSKCEAHSACGLFKVWSGGCRSSNSQLRRRRWVGIRGSSRAWVAPLSLLYPTLEGTCLHQYHNSDTSNQQSNGEHFCSASSYYLFFSIIIWSHPCEDDGWRMRQHTQLGWMPTETTLIVCHGECGETRGMETCGWWA